MKNVFIFLKEKKGYEIPLKFKLFHNITLTDDERIVDVSMNLSYSNITSLPNNIHFIYSLDLRSSQIKSLPDNLYVGGFLDLENTQLTSLPDNLYVRSWLSIRDTNIKTIPNNLYVGGSLFLDSKTWGDDNNETISNIRNLIKNKNGEIIGNIYIQ